MQYISGITADAGTGSIHKMMGLLAYHGSMPVNSSQNWSQKAGTPYPLSVSEQGWRGMGSTPKSRKSTLSKKAAQLERVGD